MRRRPLALCLAALALIFACNLAIPRPLREPDEAAWIFSTYYFRLAFLERDLRSPLWSHPDTVDHPPLAKYYFGAFLAPAGLAARSLQAKERWFERSMQPYENDAFIAELRAAIPPRALRLGRLASTLAMFAACAATAAAGALAFSPAIGALAGVLVALMPLTRMVATRAVADSPFLALLAACLATQLAWLKRPSWPLAALCGVLTGALFDTKITGALELALLLMVLRGRAAALAAACAAAAAFALNPSLWGSPWSFVAAMFRHRWEMVRLQQVVFFGHVPPRLLEQAAVFLKDLFWANDPPSAVTQAATAALACAGLAAWRRRLADAPGRAVALHAAVWTAACFFTYRLAWSRYLLPVLPFLCLTAALGAEELAARGRSGGLRLLAASSLLALALTAPARYFTRERYWNAHPAELARRYREQRAALR